MTVCRVRQPHALTDDLVVNRALDAFYGRDDAPRCPFRSNCQAEAVLHALPTANTASGSHRGPHKRKRPTTFHLSAFTLPFRDGSGQASSHLYKIGCKDTIIF